MDKEAQLGKLVARFGRKISELIAGVILAILIGGGAIALGVYGLTRIDPNAERGEFWGAIGLAALGFTLGPLFGWGAIWIGRAMSSSEIEFYEHGFVSIDDGKPTIILWTEVDRIERTAKKSEVPVLNYGLANASTWVKTYTIICRDNRRSGFTSTTHSGIRKIAAHLKEISEKLDIRWVDLSPKESK